MLSSTCTFCLERDDQQMCRQRTTMQMVQYHVIYSSERKNSGHNQNTCNHTYIKCKHNQVVAHSVRS